MKTLGRFLATGPDSQLRPFGFDSRPLQPIKKERPAIAHRARYGTEFSTMSLPLTDAIHNGVHRPSAKANATYPKRPKFFAHNFCRFMANASLANSIGHDACWLLAVIVHLEDARRYHAPGVLFFNEQLLPLLGLGSVDALARTRAKAVEAGWLNYEPGGKHRAGIYWVTIPPEYKDCNGASSDGRGKNYFRKNAETTAKKPRNKPRSTRGTLFPNPDPVVVVVEGEKQPQRPPTLDEVRQYCLDAKLTFDPQRFFDYYSAKGWKLGREPMSDWTAAARVWQGNEGKQKGKSRGKIETDEELLAKVRRRGGGK